MEEKNPIDENKSMEEKETIEDKPLDEKESEKIISMFESPEMQTEKEVVKEESLEENVSEEAISNFKSVKMPAENESLEETMSQENVPNFVMLESDRKEVEKETTENKPLEEEVTNETSTNPGPIGTRIEKNKNKVTKSNNFKLFQIILVILVVVSLGTNVFMFTQLNNSNTNYSLNSGAKVEQVNYDVKSSTSNVIDKVSDSVVGVLVYSNGSASGSGSGVVYRVNGKDAFIITNAHVVDGANDVQVIFSNKESVTATVLGSDSYSDIAVLKITADFDLTAMKCGDSGLLDQGETVLAIGSPLGIEYAGTVTQGIVSGTDRTVSVDLNDDGQDDWDMSVIQTDAAINPGNSGGALVNMAGELVGITSMKLSDTSVEGMGFALPINDVIKSVEQIIENGKVTRPQFGISGVSLSGYSSYQLRYYRINTDLTDGIYVVKVSAGGAASQAGIQEGDIIVGFDGEKITTYKSFLTALYSKEPGEKVSVVINRNGSEKTVQVTLGEQ